MRRLIVLTISFAVLAATQIVVHAELPNPPTKTELEDAVTQIRTVLQQDYLAAKTPDNRIGLARKLLELAAETNDAPVTRYALLIEARDLAANSGNAQIPLESIHMLARLHRVDVTEEQVAVLGLASRTARTASQHQALIAATQDLVEQYADLYRYDVVRRLGAIASSAARKSSDLVLRRQVAEQLELVDLLRREHAALPAAFAELREDSADPESSLKVGRFLALAKGDWPKGLRWLARGSDAKLKALAQ